ncbi:MAG: hypothetical protein ABIN99_12470 [Nitrosospira sp.]
MKGIGIAILAAYLLTGCAPFLADFQPISSSDGAKHYLVKTSYGASAGPKSAAITDLERYSNHLCKKNGYTIVSEEEHNLLTAWGSEDPTKRIFWQIKCKNAEQSKS